MDWSALRRAGFPNAKDGITPKKRKDRRRGKMLRQAAQSRDRDVMPRYGFRCIAWGVSPVCQIRACDPHELIPVGAGGSRVDPDNRVPICRADHRECQDRIGGNRLIFNWEGKAEGKKPTATIKGSIAVTWLPNPKDPHTFTKTWR